MKTTPSKPLKILLLGHADPWTIFTSYVKAYRALGHEVEVINIREAYRIGFFNRFVNVALNRLGMIPFYFGSKKINTLILQKAERMKPNLVVFYHSVHIFPDTVKKLQRDFGSIVFSWTTDATFYNVNVSRSFLRSIPFFDCHFTINSSCIPDLKQKGAKQVILPPPAADTSVHFPTLVSEEERARLGADLVFVGTYARDKRAEYSERLCRDGYDIKIYGSGWNKSFFQCRCLKKHRRLLYRGARMEEMSRVFNASNIVLAFLRAHNKDKQTTRTYEIPACGAFMLHERTNEATAIFKEGAEAEFFDGYEELKTKIDYYLTHPEERKQIAKGGHERVQQYDCTYTERVETILQTYHQITKTNNE